MDLYNLKIKAIKEELPGIKSFIFDIPKGYTWSEGSNIHLTFKDFKQSGQADKELIRHLSMSSLFEEGFIQLTTRVPGSGSDYKKRLNELSVGDEVVLFKTKVRIPLRRENKNIVLLSMGVGMAATRSMIKSFERDQSGIKQLTNININKAGYVYQEEIEGISVKGFNNIAVSDRASFYKALDDHTSSDTIYYIIGDESFLKGLIERLKNHDVPTDQIMIDKKADKKILFGL